MSELFSYKLLSHPDEYLFNHLIDVASLSKNTISEKQLSLSDGLKGIIPDVAYYLGACHDFGKGTAFFQEYIKEEDEQKKRSLKNNSLTRHGLISAIFAFYSLKQLVSNMNDYEFIPIIGFLIVKRHHGNLDNPNFEITSLNENQTKLLQKQIETLNKGELEKIYSEILPDVDINTFFNTFNLVIDEIKKGRRILRKYLGNEKSFQFYLTFQILYSILLNSDKMAASKLSKEKVIERVDLPIDLVEKYRTLIGWGKESEDKMDNLRNRIYQDITSKIPTLNLKKKIYSMNVPTGTGKTLTSLSLAIKLREKISQQLQYKPRIIYVLPFLSIIEQNFTVFEEAIKEVTNEVPTNNLILKHHHLSDIFYTTEDEEFRDMQALLLIEGWNAELVVSTFIQLFHTMISNRNHSLRKFHTLANSIIILDEIQSIPHKYWLLVKKIIDEITSYFNSYFIIVSATLPLIFDEKEDEIIELASNKESIFRELNRIDLHYKSTTLSLDEFLAMILEEIRNNSEKNILIVLNTINSAKYIFEMLRKQTIKNTEYYFLSTHITPKERLERINNIKGIGKRKVVVSTQLIEAGVDIDMDIIYRDIAPLDSINQVAGRCNRNYKKDKQIVNVVNLKDERKELYKYIYSSFLIDKTREVLNEFGPIISETSFLDMNNTYYQKIKEGQSHDEAKEIISLIEELQFDKFYESFKLIKDDYEKTDIFVELDENAKGVWKEYNKIKRMRNIYEQKSRFLDIKGEFYNYIVSIPKSKIPSSILDETYNMGFISLKELPLYYNLETGFEPKQGGVLIF